LIDTKTKTRTQSTQADVTTYVYEYDSEGRVTKETSAIQSTDPNVSGGSSFTTYKYYDLDLLHLSGHEVKSYGC
jgi:YD repeat-containing protein